MDRSVAYRFAIGYTRYSNLLSVSIGATVQPTHPIPESLRTFPDHTQLPCEDGSFVKNFQEHPQSILLTDSLSSVLARLHPEGDYAIGQDNGIYWRETDPPERGAEAPDWFYVAGVPARLDGKIRRSYVLWKEKKIPAIALEFASGNGSEERDRTPLVDRANGREVKKPGKFWVYEQIVRIPYYGIFSIRRDELEMYRLTDGAYQPTIPDASGRYEIAPLQVSLGLWRGNYQNQHQTWLRWWDAAGNLLPTGQERAEMERQKAEAERQRADAAEERARRLAERLRALGIDPEDI